MRKLIIFATATLLFIAVIYIGKRSFFLNNVANLAYGKLQPGVDLNVAIELIDKELILKRYTFCHARDARVQLENGVLVNNTKDKYNMFSFSFCKDTSNCCKSAYGKIYLTYIKEKGINYIYSPRPLFGYRIRV